MGLLLLPVFDVLLALVTLVILQSFGFTSSIVSLIHFCFTTNFVMKLFFIILFYNEKNEMHFANDAKKLVLFIRNCPFGRGFLWLK